MRLELVTVNSKLAFATENFFPKTRSLESTSKNKISKKIFFVENYFRRKLISSKIIFVEILLSPKDFTTKGVFDEVDFRRKNSVPVLLLIIIVKIYSIQKTVKK